MEKKKILILANTRFKGGISGGDAIYESFKKYWPCEITVQEMQDIDFRPFILCYFVRLFRAIILSMFDKNKWDAVYSSSDFLPDSIPALIYKFRGNRWISGFFLKAFKDNPIHYCTQKVVKFLITKFADMVIVTNPTMYYLFPDKKKTWINGGVDISLAGFKDDVDDRVYTFVFCGRIHSSKGIDNMITFLNSLNNEKKIKRVAIIGDGDLGINYIKTRITYPYVDYFGYMGEERYEIFRKSIVVLYLVPKKYAHFSMAPVEAMACGCTLLVLRNEVIDYFIEKMDMPCITNNSPCPDCDKGKGFYKSAYNSYQWAKQFDYEKQSLRVWEDVRRELFNEDSTNRFMGHDRNSSSSSLKFT